MKFLRTNLVLVVLTLLLFGVIYPLFIWGIGLFFPYQAEGQPVIKNGQVIGYKNIGQNFTEAKYFWGRPSACDYNPINAVPTNLGPANPALLRSIQQRADKFLKQNPGIKKSEIPSDLVTSSASGIDPDISPEAALVQIPRIAKSRGIDQSSVKELTQEFIVKPVLGPAHVNVLKLNLALDNLIKKD